MLGVLASKTIRGCNSLQGDENLAYFQNNCQEVMTLGDMLTRQFRTDAHFTSYRLTDFPAWPRLNLSILPEIRAEGLDIVLAYFAFDWDNPNHAEWTNESLTTFANLIGNCQDPVISAWSAIYTTLHGARIIYTMSRPVPVDEGQQHLAWMFHHFEKNGFTNIDESCKDWTRCMRCPQVTRDNIQTATQDYYSLSVQNDILDMNLVGKRSVKSVARKTYFNKEKQNRLPYEELHSLIWSKDKSSGRFKQTEYFKKAKRLLKDSPYLDILFNDAAPDWNQGRRNDEIQKMLGSIVPPLLKTVGASVHQIFSLAINPLLTLDVDQDWVAHGWNALLDIYDRETNKLNLEREEIAKKVSEGLDTLDVLVQGMKEWCKDPALTQDEETAREFARDNCMVSVEKYLYFIDKDGRFTDFAIHKDQVISRIRKTDLNTIIKTTKINYTGEEVDATVPSILNQYSTPVAEVHMKPVGGAGGYIEDINGEKPILVLSTFCRNDALPPEFNPFVDAWLQNLFGEHYEIGCSWIGNALAFEEGLICALSMEGASSAGKKLLTEGLAECLKKPYVAGPEAMYQQSSAFLKTPFLVINEAWPNIRGVTSPADKFKSLTGGDGIVVNEKFKPSVRVLCPVRLIMTANDDGIIRELIRGKDMGLDNRIAIGERLFHFKVSKKAKIYLESIGGRSFTARPGSRWIRPDSGSDKTDYIVAKHFLWLHQHRDPVNPSQRFLVMGNSAPGAGSGKQTILENLLADHNETPIVAQAIIALTDAQSGIWTTFVRTNDTATRLWVTRHGVHKYIRDVLEERISETVTYSGMLNLLEKTDPDLFDGIHWYEISVDALTMIATERGIAQTHVRNIYINRIKEGLSV
jgi:hypothetical protein